MASSPFQDLSAGSPTAQSVDVYRAGNPALWGNQYAAIQTGQLQVGKPYQWQAGDEWSGPVGPIITYVPILNADGTDTGWKAEQIAPNVYDLVTTNRDYVQHMVVRADPNSGYIEPIQDTSKQVNFGRWNYSGSGLSQFFQNPIAPLMLSALLPGAGSAIGAALGLEEGAVSSAIGTGLLSGTTTAAAGGDFAKGALTGGLGNLLGSALNTPTSVPGAEEVAAAQAASQAINPDSVFTPAVATPVPNQTNLVPQVLPPMEALTNNTSAVSSLPTIPENSIWDSYTGSFVPSTQTPSSLFPNILNNDQNNMVINFAQDVPATSDLYNLAPSTPSTGLGLQATQGEGINLFAPAQGIEGGGLGLQLPTVSNLDSMGGAQGLTTLASGGSGLLGETGLGTTSTTITNPITGQPLGQELSNINTGVTDVTGAPVSTPSTTGNVPNSLIKQLVNTLLGSNMADNTNTAALGSGLLGGAGNLLQGQYAKDAAQMIADRMATATGSAVAGSQFRPVGITTRFGASNFTVNPQTGQLESAGYTPTALSDQLQQGAQSVYNLGKGYVAQSPQEAAQSWLQAQQNLLAPSRDVALSNIRNNLFQTGREGLSVAQGGDLQSANPELAAYYNSLANQNAQLAAQAQQFGQQQAQFGTGLLGSGLNLMSGLNTLEQQPLTLGAGLGQQASAAGARAGQLGIMGTQAGQKYLMDAATYSPLANILTGVSRNPLGSQAVGNLLSQYIPQLGNWISGLSSIPGGGGLPDLTNYNLTSDNATNFLELLMATDIVSSLFGTTPEMYQAAQRQAAQQQALEMAKLDSFQRATAGLQMAGYDLGQGIGGALGVQDPQLQMAARTQELLKTVNPNNPDSLAKAAQIAAQFSPQLAVALADKATKLMGDLTKQAQESAAATASLAGAKEKEFSISDLGRGQKLAETAKYTPESIVAALQSKDLSKLIAIDKLNKPSTDFVAKAVELGFGDKPTYGAYTPQQAAAVNKALFERDIAKAGATAAVTRIDLGSAIEKVYSSQDAEGRAKAWTAAGEAYKEGNSTLHLLDNFEQTAKSGYTGAGSDAKLALSKALGAVGVPISSKATDTEISNALSSQLVQKIAKVFPGSQSNKELAELLKSKPNISQELPTILRLIDNMRMEIKPKQMTYEQLAKLPEKERIAANPNIIEVENANKLRRLRELEAKAAAGGQ